MSCVTLKILWFSFNVGLSLNIFWSHVPGIICNSSCHGNHVLRTLCVPHKQIYHCTQDNDSWGLKDISSAYHHMPCGGWYWVLLTGCHVLNVDRVGGVGTNCNGPIDALDYDLVTGGITTWLLIKWIFILLSIAHYGLHSHSNVFNVWNADVNFTITILHFGVYLWSEKKEMASAWL